MNFLIRQNKSVFRLGGSHSFGYSIKRVQFDRQSFSTKLLDRVNNRCFRLKLSPKYNAFNWVSACSSHDVNAHTPFISQSRAITLSSYLLEQSSSKVEETVKSIKNKQKEQEELNKEYLEFPDNPKPVATKKSLKARIWDEVLHYYHGFRLLFIDINICRKLLGRVLNGKTLTRRENKLLVRTTSDLFRLIPFSIFIIVPFMEILLPVFIKFFPGMLPSTFQTAKDHEDRLKQSFQVRLEMAKFLQKTLDEMAVQHKDHNSQEAKAFAEFFRKIKDPTEFVKNDEIIKFSKKLEDEITLDSLNRNQLIALCRVLELNTVGTTNILRFQLRLKLRSLAADDRVISREGVNALDLFELQQACKTRGMRAYGLSADKLRSQLQEWIDLSMNEKVPNTLLLLSRALMIAEEAPTTHKLKETIRNLPDVLGAQTKAAIGEREGKIDNKIKIEIIKEEERMIREERDEEREDEKQKANDKAPVIDEITMSPIGLREPQPFIANKVVNDTHISPKDAELLSEALKSVIGANEKLLVEKETIRDLKEEIADYKEDLEELHEITTTEVKEPVRESRGAKILFKKVNAMIGQLDKLLNDLEERSTQIQKNDVSAAATRTRITGKITSPEGLVSVDELINALKQILTTPDEAKLMTIEKVLSKIDADRDGTISANEVLKVVETIGKENVKLSEKMVEELLDLLDKEQIIEAEVKVEKAIAKSIKEADNAMKVAEEIQDLAPIVKDNAKDFTISDQKNNIVDKLTVTSDDVNASEIQKEKMFPTPDSRISSALPPTISAPPNTSQGNPKDKML